MTEKFLCPLCRSELIVTGLERLETLDEHVCNPNGEVYLKDKYECLNEKCSGYRRFIWNEDGDIYYKGSIDKKTFTFIDGNDGAIGSFARRVNIEIRKRDENFLLCTIFRRKIYVKYLYKSNENGDILNRRWKFEVIKKDGSYYISGLSMLIFSIRKFHNNFIEKSINEEEFKKEYLVLEEWQKKDWWRRVSNWWARAYCLIAGV